MLGFWKFNNLVGTLGIVLLVAGLYGGLQPGYHINTETVNAAVQLNVNPPVEFKPEHIPGYLFLAGLVGLAYQVLATGVGLLTGFFWAPQTSRR